jgi:hypothetical protein
LSFLKKLLPVAGAAAGFMMGGPAGSVALQSALGSGIGTLLAGGDVGDAVRNAALAGAGGYGLSAAGIGAAGAQAAQAAGAGSQAALLQKGTADALAKAAAMEGAAGAGAATAGAKAAQAAGASAAGLPSLASVADRFMSPMGLLTGATLLSAFEEPDLPELSEEERRMVMTGERMPDYKGRVRSNIFVDPYSGQVHQGVQERMRRDDVVYAAQGGYIQGPGTGRSDSIKSGIFQNGQKVQEARLSDGEFVMTERAVRGLGNGDRRKGAAKMYEMMRQYERMA